jgi:hypothetical protein
VNDFIAKDNYLGEIIQLSYPKVDDLVGIIKDKGANFLVFKKDLKRAYRQIPIDPGEMIRKWIFVKRAYYNTM